MSFKRKKFNKVINHRGLDRHILTISRSNKNIQVQVLNPKTRQIIFCVNTNNLNSGTKTEKALSIVTDLTQFLSSKKIDQLVFNRNQYKYHGRIKALVEEVRNNKISI